MERNRKYHSELKLHKKCHFEPLRVLFGSFSTNTIILFGLSGTLPIIKHILFACSPLRAKVKVPNYTLLESIVKYKKNKFKSKWLGGTGRRIIFSIQFYLILRKATDVVRTRILNLTEHQMNVYPVYVFNQVFIYSLNLSKSTNSFWLLQLQVNEGSGEWH